MLREEEFSPLKNAPGADRDTPATSRAALMDLHHRQILMAGGTIIDDDGRPLPLMPQRWVGPQPVGVASVIEVITVSRCSPTGEEVERGERENGLVCEISPLVSYGGEVCCLPPHTHTHICMYTHAHTHIPTHICAYAV